MKRFRIILCSLLLVLSLILIYGVSKQVFDNSETKNDETINGIAMYVENDAGTYVSATELPGEGYIFNSGKSKCNNGAIPIWDSKTNSLITSDLTTNGTSCYLYFDKTPCKSGDSACKKILSNKLVKARKNLTDIISDETMGIVYSTKDNDGTTLYFAGAPLDNYVKFAGQYWRIIRINGDGSIRLLYAGNATEIESDKYTILSNGYADGSNHYLAIDNTAYKYNTCKEMYCLGYTYNVGSINGDEKDSAAKEQLEDWYSSNIATYESSIDTNAGFCSDRSYEDGYDDSHVYYNYYGARLRLSDSKRPSLMCKDQDLFTVQGATKGNGDLDAPVGLITADELNYAGSVWGGSNINTKVFTRSGFSYWTMSPFSSKGSEHYMTILHSAGYITREKGLDRTDSFYLRPVINLKGSVTLTGDGTMSNPYVVG
ncbi:MAG: hypothetical protein E7163_05800 [Firmicutes bacterium]|nr:hypothetical protein [Bacillota bacterium]